MTSPGDLLAAELASARATGWDIPIRSQAGLSTAELSCPQWRVTIKWHVRRWLGLEFVLLDEEQHEVLSHVVDTDLYNIADARFAGFALDVEREIVEFLRALLSGAVGLGYPKGRPTIIVPHDGRFYRIQRRKHLVSRTDVATLAAAEDGAEFVSLDCRPR
jgi:hypothetical protein